jgi:hypothetical protein
MQRRGAQSDRHGLDGGGDQRAPAPGEQLCAVPPQHPGSRLGTTCLLVAAQRRNR